VRSTAHRRGEDGIGKGEAVIDLDERLIWFKNVILPHQGALRAQLRRIAPARLDVDDLVSETLARVWGARDWTRITAGKAYLFSIARNMLIDEARRETVVSFDQFADFDSLRSEHSPEPQLDARDALRQIEKIVAGLPEQARRVFVLRRIHGFSMNEIADQMGLSVSTVEKHLANALSLVAKALAEIECRSAEGVVQGSEQGRRTESVRRRPGCSGP
jgi:RNA polymerase sigma-70 factor (ECF subfamily)